MKRIKIALVLIVTFTFMQSNAQNIEAPKKAVKAFNDLTFDLFEQLDEEEKNLFFSAYSVSSALAMTYEGAKGETEKEMQNVMHYPENKLALHQGYKMLNANIQKNEKYFELAVANSLWAQKEFTFKEEYFKKINAFYKTSLEYLDFKKDAEKSRKTINQWVEKATKEKIKELIPEEGVNDMTRLVLTNAIYFKADWQNKFKEFKTKSDAFYVSENKKEKVPFMNMKIRVKYKETKDFQMIELPYKRNLISMVIMLPKEGVSLTNVTQEAGKKFLDYVGKMSYETTSISLPKFKFSSNFDLSAKLKAMGMETAFSTEADFSGMTGKQNLQISKVFHKAFIDVNEDGTEAAAATAVTMMEKTAMPPRDFKVFKADHPFIFFIKDNESQAILFSGKVANPK